MVKLLVLYTKLKLKFARKSKFVNAIDFSNSNRDKSPHLYEVRVRFAKNISKEEIMLFVCKWFRHDNYGFYRNKHIIHIDYYIWDNHKKKYVPVYIAGVPLF